MKRILFTHTNFIPYFVTGRGVAMFSYLTLGTNRTFTYLTWTLPHREQALAWARGVEINRTINGECLDTRHRYSTKKAYGEEMRVIYTNFIKALLHNKLNLDLSRFKKQEDIISYLEEFQGDKLFARNQISKLKNQGEFERIPLTPKSKEFIKYIQREFPDFDGFEFTLIKPITLKESQDTKLVSSKPTATTKSKIIIASQIKPVTVAASPTKTVGSALPKESITNVEVTPTKVTPTVTETITKIVEPVVTETIVKVIEPVAKVVEPVIRVAETITSAIPNIIINNANNANAEATTVTHNTQIANKSWDSLLSIIGLNKIAKILKDIFGFDGDGIIYLLIQLPYLVWFLIAFKDNPDIMKYLTETFGIEEYKVPDTELTPLEYNFEVPYDFDSQGLQDDDATSEDFFTEDAARNYTDNSSVEYFDYFDYYHSKPPADIEDNETTPTSKDVVEDLKEIGTSLLDSTKDKVNTVVTAMAELEPIKDQPEVHVIDDQFSGAIDVFPVTKEVQSINNYRIASSSNRTSIGGIIKWWFPMLDFYNLNYFPSYFEKFNMSTKVQPITNKVDYVKMLINELYYTLNLGKFEVPQVKFNLPEFGRSKAQSHADTLSALEGLNTNTNTRKTPNWRNTSLISDSTGFSTYFNKDWNKPRDVLLGRLPSVNSSPNDLLLNYRDSGSTRTIPTTPLIIDTNNADNSWIYDSPLPSVNSTPIRPLIYSEYYDLEEVSNTTNALATKLLNIKSAIVEVDTKIVKLKDQFIEFHHKINRFDEQIAELGKQKLQFTEKFNKGKLSASDWDSLNKIKQQLKYIFDSKASLEASNNLNNDELKSLEIKKSSLLELKIRYEKLLGNIATTPNV
jgi:hypothetical protein